MSPLPFTHARAKPAQSYLTRRQFLPSVCLLAAAVSARANENTLDMSHAVFVAMAGSRTVAFIDPDTDQIAGAIDVGLVPAQLELASSISKLLATDGMTRRLNIVDVVSATVESERLDFAPGRMVVSPDGLTAALADPDSGRLVLMDLLRRERLGEFTAPAPLRDMLFTADSFRLFISAGDSSALTVLDAQTARPLPSVETGVPPTTQALTRSPNGRRLFVQTSSGSIGVLDLERQMPLAPIQAGAGATVAFPSASGKFLLIANNRRDTLIAVGTGDTPFTTVLEGAGGVSIVYTAWFESMALAPSASSHALLMYDLDALKPAGSIPLPAAPERGGVTPDGRKLYLPLPEAKQVAVFDARTRQLAALVRAPNKPVKVLLAGSYGICH